jgi:hypothetical protein
MKKNILSAVVMIISAFSLVSCDPKDSDTKSTTTGTPGTTVIVGSSTNGTVITATGAIVNKTNDLQNFNAINVSSVIITEVVAGPSFKIEITDYENIIQYTKFEVKNNELLIFIEAPENTVISNTKSKAIVTVPANQLKKLTTSGTAIITLKDSFNGIINLTTSGTSSITAAAAASTTTLAADLSGTSRIDFLNVQAENVTALSSGTSISKFAVSKNLDATLTDVSTLSYKGDPTVTKKTSFNSKLIKL